VIYHLLAAPGRVSDLILQPGEVITSIAAGDTARWTIGDTSSGSGEAKRVHVLVKPFSAGLSTNLVIATDRRTYHLQLSSTVGTAMAGISWSYPADELLAVKRKEAEAQAVKPVAAGLDVQSLNFSYAISGDTPAWRPLRTFDDGRQTFIEFPASIAVGEAPPLFVLGDKGAAELVNYRMSGRYYVVDRLFSAAELRLGGKQQAVVRSRAA
jgi:type IV secretion system protein VirB9